MNNIKKIGVTALAGSLAATSAIAGAMSVSGGATVTHTTKTGAVVGQQPFGGSRASGTNDKAGSSLNLLRWTSVRTVKETFNTPEDYRYPFMSEE